MKPFVMQTRQQAYEEILSLGLLAIRESACGGNVKLCEIEAEHIHNLPSLLHEPNEARHHYYIDSERSWYLRKLKEHANADYAAQRLRLYSDPWKILATLAADEKGTPKTGPIQ